MDDGLNTVHRIVGYSLACSVVGASTGGLLSTVRSNAHIPLYMVSMGSNFMFTGLLYFSTLEILNRNCPSDWREDIPPTAAGGLTGALIGGAFAGPKKALTGAFVMSAVGYLAHHVRIKGIAWKQAEKLRIEEDYRRMKED